MNERLDTKTISQKMMILVDNVSTLIPDGTYLELTNHIMKLHNNNVVDDGSSATNRFLENLFQIKDRHIAHLRSEIRELEQQLATKPELPFCSNINARGRRCRNKCMHGEQMCSWHYKNLPLSSEEIDSNPLT